MVYVLDIINIAGTPFRVVFDPEAGNTEKGLVSFYDRRYDFSEHGQFVSSYYRSTLVEGHAATRGLNLHGGVDDWYVDSHVLGVIMAWLATL